MPSSKKPSRMKGRHSCSVYYPPAERWEMQLGDKLAARHNTSLSELMRQILRKALVANGLMNEKGDSLVTGIGPSKTSRKRLRLGTQENWKL